MVLTGAAIIPVIMWIWTTGYQRASSEIAKRFEVRRVLVFGTSDVGRREELERMMLSQKQNLLSLNTRRQEIRLQAHSWVKRATVRRVFPDGVAVEIVERRPAAIVRDRDTRLLIDDEGVVLSTPSREGYADLPVLIGINSKALLDQQRNSVAAALHGMELARLLSVSGTSGGSLVIDVENPDNAIAHLDGLRLQFGTPPFGEKWERYQKVQPYAAINAGPNDVDLRYPGKVIVRERG